MEERRKKKKKKTNARTVSQWALVNFWDTGWDGAYMGFPERVNIILNWTGLNRTCKLEKCRHFVLCLRSSGPSLALFWELCPKTKTRDKKCNIIVIIAAYVVVLCDHFLRKNMIRWLIDRWIISWLIGWLIDFGWLYIIGSIGLYTTGWVSKWLWSADCYIGWVHRDWVSKWLIAIVAEYIVTEYIVTEWVNGWLL